MLKERKQKQIRGSWRAKGEDSRWIQIKPDKTSILTRRVLVTSRAPAAFTPTRPSAAKTSVYVWNETIEAVNRARECGLPRSPPTPDWLAWCNNCTAVGINVVAMTTRGAALEWMPVFVCASEHERVCVCVCVHFVWSGRPFQQLWSGKCL